MISWRRGVAAVMVGLWGVTALHASEATYQGTVAAVDKTRVQVKTGDRDGKAAPKAEWFAVTDTTKVTRGTAAVPFATAKIKAGERVTVIVKDGDEAGVDWVCSMHPKLVRAAAGACPLCGMALKSRARHAKASEIHLDVP